MEFYTAMKKNTLLLLATICTNEIHRHNTEQKEAIGKKKQYALHYSICKEIKNS